MIKYSHFIASLTRNFRRLVDSARQMESPNDTIGNFFSFSAIAEKPELSRTETEECDPQLVRKLNLENREIQESLLRKEQAGIQREMACRTAHEILNPLTAILSRLEKSFATLAANQTLEVTHSAIVEAWKKELEVGGAKGLARNLATPSTLDPNLLLIEEDLTNLQNIRTTLTVQSSDIKKDLSFINDQAQRIHRIVDQMREYGRSAEKSDTECMGALREATETMRDSVEKNGIFLVFERNASQGLAVLNRDELIQIVTNLIRNSMQAILSHPEHKLRKRGCIRVTSYNVRETLVVEVIDNGIGIAPDKHKHLFQQGYTTKSPSQGTGLGLAICRRYARAFSGEVELLYSEPNGRGTAFRLSIPLKDTVSAFQPKAA